MDFNEFFEEWNSNKDYITVKTSGSTGIPKAINLNKNFVKESALRTNTFFALNCNSHLHSCVSADFIGGKMMAVRAFLCGGSFSHETPSNKPLTLYSPNDKLDLVAVVPSQMLHIVENTNILPKIRNIIIGGSAIHPSLRSKIADSGLNAYETYGMTETASHIALRKVTFEEHPFTTLPGITVDTDSNECLNIKFRSGESIQTNDISEVISPTQFLIKGRKDSVIISGGKKINPFELESKISPFINQPFIVKGIEDEKWGKKLILIIEGSPVDNQYLKDAFKTILESWETPKQIFYTERLPRTSNGKIIRD